MAFEERDNIQYVISAEYEILKCLIDFPDADFTGLTENSFPHKIAQVVYSCIIAMRNREERINKDSLLRESNRLEAGVTIDVINKIYSFSPDVSNIPGAISALKDSSIKASLNVHLSKLSGLLQSSNPLSSEELYAITSEMQTTMSSMGSNVQSKTLEQGLEDYDVYLDERKKGDAFITGDDFLDKNLTRKFRGGQTITLAGATGAGKSAYALNIVKTNINLSVPTIYFTLEMDEESTLDRLIAQELNMTVDALYDKSQVDYVKHKKKDLVDKYENKPFRLVDNPSVDLATVHYLIREFKALYGVDYVCVIIDLVTMIKEFIDVKGSGAGTLANTIEMSVNMLNAIAKLENVCFINVVQFGRSADSARIESLDELHKLRPTLNAIKNSHAIAERSRVVLSVFRPRYYAQRLFPEHPELEFMQDEMQIQILKQSQGDVGQIGRYLFNGPTFSITARPEGDAEPLVRGAVPGTENLDY